MSKLSLAVMAVAVCVAGCASQRSANAPDASASGVESEFNDTEADYAAEDSSAPADSDMAQSEEYDSASMTESAPPAVHSARKSCAGLEQKLCEISVGCAWSTEMVCVEH